MVGPEGKKLTRKQRSQEGMEDDGSGGFGGYEEETPIQETEDIVDDMQVHEKANQVEEKKQTQNFNEMLDEQNSGKPAMSLDALLKEYEQENKESSEESSDEEK